MLPIWVGKAEASALSFALEGVATPRPMSHDLIKAVLDAVDAKVINVVVTDMKDNTYYSKIHLMYDDAEYSIDSRPSDAIALAVRAQVPIYADESVLEKAGVLPDQEEPVTAGESRTPVNEEELERMSAFRDFIESLDLDDFDKRSRS